MELVFMGDAQTGGTDLESQGSDRNFIQVPKWSIQQKGTLSTIQCWEMIAFKPYVKGNIFM